MRIHSVARWLLCLACLGAGRIHAAAPRGGDPVIFRSGVGRFEIAANDGTAAATVNAMADEAWRLLAAPLALPESFSSPVFVRLIPAAEWSEPAAFRVFVEPGGLVSARVRWDAQPQGWVIRRALVQALLLRLGVTHFGVRAALVAPLWLEHGCVGWWHTHQDAAQLDALKQETAGLPPPSLAELLAWQRGGTEPRPLSAGSVWLLTFFQAESPAGEWPSLLRRLIAGDEALPALATQFPGRFGNDAERELWWQTGWHHLRRVHALPTLGAAESRLALSELARLVVAVDGEHDAVVSVQEALGQSGEVWLDLELQRRTTEVNRLLPSLHPFYRNPGLSLAAALAGRSAPARRDELCRAFDNDWRDALELEAAAAAALDWLERQLRAGP